LASGVHCFAVVFLLSICLLSKFVFDAFAFAVASVYCTRRMKTKSVDYSMLYLLYYVFSAIRKRVAVAQRKKNKYFKNKGAY